MNKTITEFAKDDIFGINNMNTEKFKTLDGFYKATNVYLNAVEFTESTSDWNNYDETNPTGSISIFTSNRVADLKEANNNVTANIKDNEIIWVDNDDTGKWAVYKNNKIYNEHPNIRSTADLDRHILFW